MKVCWEKNTECCQRRFVMVVDPEAGNECALSGPGDLPYEFPRV